MIFYKIAGISGKNQPAFADRIQRVKPGLAKVVISTWPKTLS
jgi:hypothetical protein